MLDKERLRNLMGRVEIVFRSGNEALAGDLVTPDGNGPFPAVLFIAGGTNIDRLHRFVGTDGFVADHSSAGWFGDRLAEAGIASLSWDKRGVGASSGGDRISGDPPGDRDAHTSVATDVADAIAALHFLADRPEIKADHITIVGHSAGVYFSCLVAKQSRIPSSYVLWSGVHMGILDLMYKLNMEMRDFSDIGPKEKQYVHDRFPEMLAVLDVWPQLVEAAHGTNSVFEWESGGVRFKKYLTRLREELATPRSLQVRHVTKPALVIHGGAERSVPVSDAVAIRDALINGGNHDVSFVVVPGADHGMRVAPSNIDYDERNPMYQSSLDFPYSEFFVGAVSGWILDQIAMTA